VSWCGCLQGDQVKKGQILGAIEQLGTVVDVKVGRLLLQRVADTCSNGWLTRDQLHSLRMCAGMGTLLRICLHRQKLLYVSPAATARYTLSTMHLPLLLL